MNNPTKTLEKSLSPRGCKRAGITKRISPHGLRHTVATLLVDADVKLTEVQRFLGHSDVRTTMRYYRAKEDLDNHAAHKVSY